MREIKFRGKRVDTGEWVYGCLINYLPNTNPRIITFELSGDQNEPAYRELNFEVIPESVGQFIGLTDKKGKDVYEGDIIKMGENIDCYFAPRAVEFTNGSWMGRGCRVYTNQDKHDYKGNSNQENWEIIGNIYEETELLTNKQK